MAAVKSAPKAITVRGAWLTYLRETEKLAGKHYEEVETWAWQRLQENLIYLHRPRG